MSKKKPQKKNYMSFNHPDLKNSFSTLFANIRFAAVDKPNKSIVVTSVGMDEGKSTVASNLALSIVNAGQTCVLVDADLRKHTLCKMLNVNAQFGLYSLLSGNCAIYDAINKTNIDGLFFIDCEPDIPNPADIVGSERFASLIEYLENNFDYVILDTPPLISFVDGALVSSFVDATLLVVREGKTKKKDIKNAVAQLDQANANIIGTILTFSSDTTESDYYYAYYNKEGKRVRKSSKSTKSMQNTVDATSMNQNLNSWMNTGTTPNFQAQNSYQAPQFTQENFSNNEYEYLGEEDPW